MIPRKMNFSAERSYGWGPNGHTESWKISDMSRLSNVIESNERWETEEEAKAAAARANAGDTSGLTFSSFADD